MAEDKSDTALVDRDTESVKEGVPAFRVTPVKKEARLDGAILVD